MDLLFSDSPPSQLPPAVTYEQKQPKFPSIDTSAAPSPQHKLATYTGYRATSPSSLFAVSQPLDVLVATTTGPATPKPAHASSTLFSLTADIPTTPSAPASPGALVPPPKTSRTRQRVKQTQSPWHGKPQFDPFASTDSMVATVSSAKKD